MLNRERRAVTVLFFVTGVLFASFLPRLPEVKDHLELSEGDLGIALLAIGLGGFVGSLATRWVVPRIGTRQAGVGAVLLTAAGVPLIGRRAQLRGPLRAALHIRRR